MSPLHTVTDTPPPPFPPPPPLQREQLGGPLDLVVATPGRLLQHLKEGSVHLGDVRYVVLDEADTMLDRGFEPEVTELLRPLRARVPPGQVVLVAATLTRPVTRLLETMFPGAERVATSSLHRAVPNAKHAFIEVPTGEDKLALALRVLTSGDVRGSPRSRTLIFCNTVASCRAVEHTLREARVPTVCYHGAMPAEERAQSIEAFRAVGEAGGGPVLVATDLAARGLDFECAVDHVVNFDFPLNSVDYLHRSGRTARAGARGRVTSLLLKRDHVLAEQIEATIRSGGTLEALSSDLDEVKEMKRKELAEKRGGRHGARPGTGRAGGRPPAGGKSSWAGGGRSGTRQSTPAGAGKPGRPAAGGGRREAPSGGGRSGARTR